MIKNNLAKYRGALKEKITQKEFAKMIGVGKNYIFGLENNTIQAKPEVMEKICKYFGVSLGQMFYIDEDEQATDQQQSQ
jgi:DNA-binding XRE family transcriptional regulator